MKKLIFFILLVGCDSRWESIYMDCFEFTVQGYLENPIVFCRDTKNRIVLDFSSVLSNTCTDSSCTDAFPLNTPFPELQFQDCNNPSTFDGYPAWALNGCVYDTKLFEDPWDSRFSQGVGNFVSKGLEPFRYINDGEGRAKIQFFNVRGGNKILKPSRVNGLVDVTNEVVINYEGDI